MGERGGLGVALATFPKHTQKKRQIMAYEFTPETTTANEMGAIPAGGMESSRRQLLNMRPSSRFYYIHHPDAWHLVEIEGAFQWLPRLRSFRITAGVNGVRQTRGRNPKPDDRAARVELIDRGYTLIPYDAIEGGYCWKYAGKRGPVYLERWAVPKQVGSRTIIKSDQAGLWAFCRHLITESFIEKPDPDILDIMGDALEQTIERDASNLHVPAIAARHAENLRRLEGMKKATKAMFAAPKATKKKAKK